MKELKDIVLTENDIVRCVDESGQIFKVLIMHDKKASSFDDGKILKIERPTYKTIYEAPKQILDKEEKEYLEAVIRPFRDRVKHIEKEEIDFYSPTNKFLSEYIYIDLGNEDESFSLPRFEKNKMYKGMKLNKEYTLDELGLFKE